MSKRSHVPAKVPELVIKNALNGTVKARKAGNLTVAAHTPAAPKPKPAMPPPMPPFRVSLRWVSKFLNSILKFSAGDIPIMRLFLLPCEDFHGGGGCKRKRGGLEAGRNLRFPRKLNLNAIGIWHTIGSRSSIDI